MTSAMTATLALTLTLVSGGCAALADMTTARPLGAQRFELGVALTFYPSLQEPEIIGLPAVDLSFRCGVADRVDVGLRVSSMLMVMLDTKIALVDAADHGVALMPAAGISFAPLVSDKIVRGGVMVQLDLPLLVDYRFDATRTLTLSPRYTVLLVPGEAAARHYLGGGVTGSFDVDSDVTVAPFVVGLFGLGDDRSLLRNIAEIGVVSRFR